MRRSSTAATLLIAGCVGCGRLQFDPLGQGGTGDAGGSGDGNGNGNSDGTVGDGQTSCSGANLFCDGLEDPSLSVWSSQFGVVQHTTSRAHSGSGSLLATSDGTLGGSAVTAPHTAVVSGGLHARSWFYVPSNFAIQKFNLFELKGSGPGVMALIDQGELNGYLAVGAGQTIFSSMTFPLDEWVCIGLDVGVADAGGTFALSFNGSEVGMWSNVDTLSPGGYDRVTVGMPYAAPGQQMGSVFSDDVVVSTQPVGCN